MLFQNVNEERTNKLEEAVSSYKTAPKTIFSGLLVFLMIVLVMSQYI